MRGWLSPGVPNPNLGGISVAPFGTPGSSDIPTAAKILASTWNFLLPPDWTQHDLTVTISINNGGYSGFQQQPRQPECSAGVSGQCFNNNEVKLHLPFRTPNDLVVNPVFIHVSGKYKGQTYNNVQASEAQFDTIIQGLNELYPMNVRAGARKDIAVSPDISNDDLLDRIDDASGLQPCFAFASGPNVWLGLLPNDQARGLGFAANSDGVAGTANLGSSTCAVPSAWADVDTPVDAAHEIGHLIGFDHWGCEHHGDEECTAFPIPHGAIGGIGIDIAKFVVIPEDTSSPPPHSHDFMVTFVDDRSKWVSWYTYQILMTHSTFGDYDTNDPPALIVRGTIAIDGSSSLSPAYRMDVPQPIRDTIIEDDSDQIFTIRGYDARGNTILVHNFEPEKHERHDPNHRHTFAFTEAVPMTANLERLAVFKGARQLGELRPSVTAPTMVPVILAPATGDRWLRSTTEAIRWTTPDPRLVAMVEFSPDGGKTRILLGRDIKGTSLAVNSNELPSSDNAVVLVQLSDGLHTAEASSPTFTVDAKPPAIHIITPKTRSVAVVGMPLNLYGRGFSRQEALKDSQFRWSSNRDGFLGRGSRLTTSHLRKGNHIIALTVTDSLGLSATERVRIRITDVGSATSHRCVLGFFTLGLASATILGFLVLVAVRRSRRNA
jgi:hypothetical protein